VEYCFAVSAENLANRIGLVGPAGPTLPEGEPKLVMAGVEEAVFLAPVQSNKAPATNAGKNSP
jgi:hypothetical protein